ncbi:MAG: zinc ribbon domain-containing protein [Chloroflexi bacterium]|nr:zinc ribbon domain-containing protein [Chloroflexota bacterium]
MSGSVSTLAQNLARLVRTLHATSLPGHRAAAIAPLHLVLAVATFAAALSTGFWRPALAADEPARFKTMKLSVWPEYDEPRVLVIYDGQMAETSGYPKQIAFRVPKDAEMNQVCGISDKNEHLCQLYETKEDGDFKLITYNVPVPHFFLEYYWYPIRGEGQRDISYAFSTVSPMDKLEVEVQQPLRSIDFTVSPTPLTTASDNQGFKYAQYTYDKVNADQKLDLKIGYSKTDGNPSVPKQKQGGGTGLGGSTNLNVWLLVAGAAIVGVVAYFGLSRRSRLVAQPASSRTRPAIQTGARKQPGVYRPQSASSRPTTAQKTQAPASRAPAGRVFCTSCGAELTAGDRFCSECGQKVRARG